jgi:hypothetical protein
LAPGSNDPIVFKGGAEQTVQPKMSVPQAQQVVSKMAKSAMNRPM